MALHQPFQVTAFHSCDKEVGLSVLNGKNNLLPSNNRWDWLGEGIYFWEQNPYRALEYAKESSKGEQFNKVRIKNPFVLGALIDLGNCLNLVESQSLQILSEAYSGLQKLMDELDEPIPKNKGNNRALDCAVIKFVHQSRKGKYPPFDTIRAAFSEGREAYPGANFTVRHHVQICVLNPEMIQGYFLPRPLSTFNPDL